MSEPLSVGLTIKRWVERGLAAAADRVAIEEPLEIRLGYGPENKRRQQSVSITMRTPGHDRGLALGFLYSEGIITRSADVAQASHCGPAAPGSGLHNVVRVELDPSCDIDLGRLARHFYTTSSCGVCGKSSLEALAISAPHQSSHDEFRVSAAALQVLPEALGSQQDTFDETGGLHAAALFDEHGEIELVREDVGRHNAVDKVIGAMLMRQRLPVRDRGLLVSGRASFELMQKAMMAGSPMLAAIGAPSSLAVSLADQFSITLIGFLRTDRFNVYAGEQRVSLDDLIATKTSEAAL